MKVEVKKEGEIVNKFGARAVEVIVLDAHRVRIKYDKISIRLREDESAEVIAYPDAVLVSVSKQKQKQDEDEKQDEKQEKSRED